MPIPIGNDASSGGDAIAMAMGDGVNGESVLMSGICVVVLAGPLMLVVGETNVHGKEVCSVCYNIYHTIKWVLNLSYNDSVVHLACMTTVYISKHMKFWGNGW